ncbi:hypothetical protein CV702_03130 [Lactococcus lactis subsp. lactis]|nr:hypothetical protein CV702_03130 [Lactococcus lactis subsp. lactis]
MSNYYCVNLSYCLALKSCKGSACASSFGNEVTTFSIFECSENGYFLNTLLFLLNFSKTFTFNVH